METTIDVNLKQSQVFLNISGHLNLSAFHVFKDSINKALKYKKEIVLSLQNAKSIDVASLQLIAAIRYQCNENKIPFSIKLPVSGDLVDVLARTGFNKLFHF